MLDLFPCVGQFSSLFCPPPSLRTDAAFSCWRQPFHVSVSSQLPEVWIFFPPYSFCIANSFPPTCLVPYVETVTSLNSPKCDFLFFSFSYTSESDSLRRCAEGVSLLPNLPRPAGDHLVFLTRCIDPLSLDSSPLTLISALEPAFLFAVSPPPLIGIEFSFPFDPDGDFGLLFHPITSHA